MAFSDDDIAAELEEAFGDSRVETYAFEREAADRVLVKYGNSAVAKKHWYEHRRDLKLAFSMGLGVRAAARFARCSTWTSRKWLNAFRGEHVCQCGKPATHNGWCAARYQRSPKRQAFIKRWTAEQRDGRTKARARKANAA